MIATGTDVKPLEVLIFLRDVKSELYFEQMKGRGARTIPAEKLREVTPDAEAKTRFVLIDAVGVSESLKTVSQPLERDRVVSLRQADRRQSPRAGATTTPSPRLPRGSRRSTGGSATRIARRSSRRPAASIFPASPRGCSTPSIPDALAKRVPKDAPEPEQKRRARRRRTRRRRIFDDPALRRLLKEVKAAADIRIDTISTDAVVSSGWDEKKATDAVERFSRFLEERRDELVGAANPLSAALCAARLTYAGGRRSARGVEAPALAAGADRHLARL